MTGHTLILNITNRRYSENYLKEQRASLRNEGEINKNFQLSSLHLSNVYG